MLTYTEALALLTLVLGANLTILAFAVRTLRNARRIERASRIARVIEGPTR